MVSNDTKKAVLPPAKPELAPKACFACKTPVEGDCRKCPKCGCASFFLTVEKTEPIVTLQAIPGEDGWKQDDAHTGPEKLLQKVCHNRLSLLGVKYIVHLPARARALAGMPDLLFAWRGLPCAVELKNRAGRIDAAQRDALARLALDNWRVSVIYSLPQLDAFLASITAPINTKAKGG